MLSESPEDSDGQGGRSHRERHPQPVSQSQKGTNKAKWATLPASESRNPFKPFQILFPAKGTKLGSGGEGSMAEARSAGEDSLRSFMGCVWMGATGLVLIEQ